MTCAGQGSTLSPATAIRVPLNVHVGVDAAAAAAAAASNPVH
jgi:hypothetical protein